MTKATSIREVFDVIRARTFCPFAPSASVRYGPIWDPDMPGRTDELSTRLTALGEAYAAERLAGFVFGVRGSCVSTDEAGRLLNRVLSDLKRSELGLRVWRWPDDVESPGWQFSFQKVRYFVNVFAPCYGRDHSKWSPWHEGIIVFMQPEGSFEQCGVNSSRRELRQQIRRRFAAEGQPYSGDLIDTRIEAHLYVFPEHGAGADPVVRWWQDNS